MDFAGRANVALKEREKARGLSCMRTHLIESERRPANWIISNEESHPY